MLSLWYKTSLFNLRITSKSQHMAKCRKQHFSPLNNLLKYSWGISFIIKPTRCTSFTNLFSHETLHFGQFVCLSSGVYSLYTQQWYMSYRFVGSFRAGPVWSCLNLTILLKMQYIWKAWSRSNANILHHTGGIKYTDHGATGKQKLTHQVCLLKILPSLSENNVNSWQGSTYHILDP
jgi:hypothetical protein